MHHPQAASQLQWPRAVNAHGFALAPYFAGNDHGAYYTSLGRGGKAIFRPWKVLEGALMYTPKLPVQVLGLGTPISGSYTSQPLAIPSNGNSSSL